MGTLDWQMRDEIRMVFLPSSWEHPKNMSSASRDIVIEVPPKDFFDVISDYERYPEILPEMISAQIVHRDDAKTVAEFTINIIKRVSYTLALVERPPYRLEWELVKGPFNKNSGCWQLEELENGWTHAHYSVDVSVGIFVPKSVSNRVVGKTMPAVLNHFKHWAETHPST